MKKVLIISTLLLIFFLGSIYVYKSTLITDYDDSTESLKKSTNPSETLQKIENKEQGIYYFGFEKCPWCKELLPVLDQTLKENKLAAYTIDTKAESFYENNKLEKIFTNITKEKELTVPFIIFINGDKNIRYNIGTVNNHFADKQRLSKKQRQELISNLDELIKFSTE